MVYQQEISNNINGYESRSEDATIDIAILFGHILIKWKMILLASLCAAIIGGIAGFFAIHSTGATTSPASKSGIAEAASVLTEDQLAEAEEYYSEIVAYDRVIDEQKRFNDGAYIMHMDPQTSVGYILQYYVETDLTNAISSYSLSTLYEEDYSRLEEILGTEEVRTGFGDAVVFETKDLTGTIDGVFDNTMHRTLLSVSIIAPDKDTCEKITEVVNEAIRKKTESLKKGGINIECILADEGYYQITQDRIESAKQKLVNNLGTLITNKTNYINNVIAKIDANEKTYIDSLLDNTPDDADSPSNDGGVSFKKIIKYMLMGFLVGCAISLLCVAFCYVFAGKLRSPDEVKECFGLPVFQTVSKTELQCDASKTNIIKKCGLRLIGIPDNTQETLPILLEELQSMISREDIRNPYIAVDAGSMYAEDIARKICEGGQENVKYSMGAFYPDADSMKQLLEADAVIVIPVMDITKLKSIETIMDICGRNGKRVIGVIPVRDRSIYR